jgi:hypothetical protein
MRRRRPLSTAAVGRCAWLVGYWRPRCPRPAQGCGRVRGGQQPSGQHPAAPQTLPRCPVPRTPAGVPRQVRAAGGHPTVRTRGQWTRLVDTAARRWPALRDTRDGGRVMRTPRHRYAGQPAAEPSTATPNVGPRNGTGRCGSGQHPPWPDRQIRRLVISVDLVASRGIWPAQVGHLVDPDRSRLVPSDRPDDQTDDQARQAARPPNRRRPRLRR